MPGCGTYSFTDPESYRTSIRGASVDLVLTSPGGFKARVTRAELDNLWFLRAREELAHITYIALAPDRNVIGFPLHSEPPPIWNGVELQAGDIVFHSRGERFHQCATGPSGWGWISLSPEYLAGYGRALTGEDLLVPTAGQVLRPPGRLTARLMRLHAKIGGLAETKAEMLAHAEVARAIEQELIGVLITCLSKGETRSAWAEKRRHASIMVRFQDALAADPDHARSVPELCATIGVSELTLRACCHELLGMSARRYLLLRRLNRVRSGLLHADPTTTRVADQARRHGFTELGRFAVVYRTVFGETPSNTLRGVPGEVFLHR